VGSIRKRPIEEGRIRWFWQIVGSIRKRHRRIQNTVVLADSGKHQKETYKRVQSTVVLADSENHQKKT
jgi:hypothetical protein